MVKSRYKEPGKRRGRGLSQPVTLSCLDGGVLCLLSCQVMGLSEGVGAKCLATLACTRHLEISEEAVNKDRRGTSSEVNDYLSCDPRAR
jgi:hypothetical protein